MRPRTLVAALAIVATAFAFGSRTGAQRSESPREAADNRALREGRFAQAEVIVEYAAGASDADKQEARGWVAGNRKESVRRGRGGREGDVEVVTIPVGMPIENAVGVLKAHPGVAFAEPNWTYTHEATSNDPYYTAGSLWGMLGDTTSPVNQYGSQAGEAWAAGYTGSASTLVGVIDEGIDFNHPDLAGNIWTNPYDPADGVDNDGNGFVDDIHGWDFYQNNNSVFDGGPGSTVDAHGTHVSGTIGGVGGNGVGVAGVNWSVGIISAKFLGPSGGSTANAVKALDYLRNLKLLHPTLNIVATNNSWGGGGYSQALHDAIIRAAKAGILFDAAAGNNAVNNDTTAAYPANYDTSVGTSTETAASYNSVIAIAAINSTGGLSYFSDYGPTKVHLGAPGEGIYSTTPNNTYSNYSGTSMATPHVTGAAALYAAANPGATAESIRSAILLSAQNTPTASLAGKTVTGGRLNIGLLMGIAPPPPPTPPADPTGLGATGVSTSQINLAWTDVASDEDGYRVERCTGSGCTNFTQIATLGVNASTYSNTGLAASTLYRYRVRASKGAVFSNYSNIADGSTQAVPASFTLSASPSSRSIRRNRSTSYSIAIGRSSGFSSAVTLSVTGMGSGTSASFSPNPAGGNSSTLSVSTSSNATRGTFTLTITGVGGGLTRTTTVKLTVQ